VPNHPARSRARGQTVAFALQVEKSDDRSILVCYQLDRISFVALLLALDGIEECRVEKRQQAADQPATLVSLFVRTDLSRV